MGSFSELPQAPVRTLERLPEAAARVVRSASAAERIAINLRGSA